MKSQASHKKNLSLQLVTFMAAVYSSVFGAIANVRAADAPNVNGDLSIVTDLDFPSELTSSKVISFEQQQLIAQVWSQLDTQELSLSTTEQNSDRPNSQVPTEQLSVAIN